MAEWTVRVIAQGQPLRTFTVQASNLKTAVAKALPTVPPGATAVHIEVARVS
jgi:hypothetical protein